MSRLEEIKGRLDGAYYEGSTITDDISYLVSKLKSQNEEIEQMAERVYYAIQIWENMGMEDDPTNIMLKVISRLKEGKQGGENIPNL